ncbi:MAG: hypothetical protein LBV30_04520 [Propionibacteriaceae bacterium]|nr:hypothetical protein [Propionibacteriaceae bacterium]
MDHPMFGQLCLISGPDSFLRERAITRAIAAASLLAPGASVNQIQASDLTSGSLDQLCSIDLFSTASIACIIDAQSTPAALRPTIETVISQLPDSLALIISHNGERGDATWLKVLTKLADQTDINQALNQRGIETFTRDEVTAAGASIEPGALRILIDAVGNDTRALAAAVAQLVADSDSNRLTLDTVGRYFSGRATVSSFTVVDDIVAGRIGPAIGGFRWAVATGVPRTSITAALASSLRQMGRYLAIAASHRPTADEVGAPAWKIDRIGQSARQWGDIGLADAISAVSQADFDIKGGAGDPDYAIERLIIRLYGIHRRAGRSSR